ncbi:alpha/beta fold hydrolase [Rhodococcus triatomae]|uniref:Lipase (Class 2) n=1 Tax=Rhodococcus triatomae TaxID=300028 RepID=A0A1G8L2Q4_9NOCA|nr:alpha/beta fold hydrolase [Rhodococcus triatomae]QNG20492.1 alpha/beta fold hydrolase [Rhodococcus triatomae]QNG23590.1 alpha/beta fold hydrolase [Rhodococcus triatomae]SDI49936.1 Lipase (class 2) [Rhodococcus triatomae]
MALTATPAAADVVVPPANGTVGVGAPATSFPEAFANGLLNPNAAPVGANDWGCKPSAAHPRPVVLAHGTWENAYNNWSGVAPALAAEGYCVFAINYGQSDLLQKGGLGTIIPGVYGVKPIEESAQQLAAFVDAVLAGTGASKVDIVGHSQGGLMARQYLKFEGGADKVQNLVTLGATNHGTTLLGIGALNRFIGGLGLNLDPVLDYLVGVSGIQQVYDSPLLKRLNAEGDTIAGIDYTIIGTMFDEVTTPWESTFLNPYGPGNVRNVTLQDGCPVDVSDHLSITYSPRAIDWIKHALDPAGFPESSIVCAGNAPIGGRSDGGPGGTGSLGSGSSGSAAGSSGS